MTDISRREALAAMAAAAVSGVQKQAPLPPGRATLLEVPTKTLLTPADFSCIGYLRFPPDFDDLWYAYGQLSLRRVGSELRVLSAGSTTHDFPVLEYRVPDAAPSMTMATAPMLTPIRNWGTIPETVRITGGSGGSVVGGFLWDEARQGIWATYKDWYAPVEHHPTILFLHLPANGVMKIYGPWRTEWNSQRTGGGLTLIPQAFVDAHLGGGSNVGVMSYSGGAASPFGANLSRMRLPDPFTVKPDVSVPAAVSLNPPWTIANDGLILHDIDHRQARDQRYKICGWNGLEYDCAAPGVPVPEIGPPLFGGKLANDHDTFSSKLWIDLPDKHGLVGFGQLASTPEGYRAPGDPDGLIHAWYGAALSTQNPMGKERYCCHGQYDEYWNATGPGAHRRVAKGWIYNPNDLAATAQKKADLWSRVPTTDAFEWGKVIPYLNGPVRPGAFGGSGFEAASRTIYVVLAGADTSFPGKPRPLIAVLSVK
jgi:hypothetical protein